MRDRAVIHLNVADFAVAVERQVDQRLRHRPVIVAPEAAVRAAVYDMSEEAYQQGVRKGMSLKTALRRCREAIVLPPHPDRYERAMRTCFQQVLPYSPLAEMADRSGHLFLDVTGCSRLFGPPQDIAWRIRRAFRSEIGLDPIWSVAANKLVAKVATRLVKPFGELVVPAGSEESFLAPLPLYLLPGLLPEDRKKLADFNFFHTGQVAALEREQLALLFGRRAVVVQDRVRGVDESPVQPAQAGQRRFRCGHTFGTDTSRAVVIERVLYGLVEKIGVALRRQRLAAKRLGLVLDFSDGLRVIRQAAARPPASDDPDLFAVARRALQAAWQRRVRVRHLTLICDRTGPAVAQLELFAESRVRQLKKRRLMETVDRIRVRFGAGAVQTGRMVSPGAA